MGTLSNRFAAAPSPSPSRSGGHSFQVVAIDGNRFAGALRDMVLVPPKTTVKVAFDADNPG
jgi:FtsP/CotA-like multicopper oxidase with cupredoxin domain